MNDLTPIGIDDDEISFSSRMIAEKTGKTHPHICRDIRTICAKLNVAEAKFGSRYLDENNQHRREYLLPERYLKNVLMDYSVKRCNAVIMEVYRLKKEHQKLK